MAGNDQLRLSLVFRCRNRSRHFDSHIHQYFYFIPAQMAIGYNNVYYDYVLSIIAVFCVSAMSYLS